MHRLLLDLKLLKILRLAKVMDAESFENRKRKAGRPSAKNSYHTTNRHRKMPSKILGHVEF